MLVGYSTGGISVVLKNLPDLPPFWSTQRDDILASTMQESRWAQAVGIAVMKFCSRSWDIDGNVPFLRKERARTIVRGYDYVGQVSRGFTDYLLRDNGWWIEIVRQSSAAGSKVLGLNYLSSARCWPTGNPDIPVIYWDRLGKYHELRQHQVIRLVDMPDGNNILGVGMCAARRAYNDIRNYAAVMRYRLEKMTGARPLSIYFITGVTKEQIQSATMSAREAREAEGIVAFGGAAIVPFMQRDNISQVEIPLSALPDQFKYNEETTETDNAYANALPLVISLDLRAMTGQRAGSGAQSQVIDDHSVVKETVFRDFAQKINNEDVWHVLPAGTSFYFVKNDLVDRKREADIVNVYVTAASTAVSQMGLDPERAVEWLSDKDVFPSAWGVNSDSQSGRLDDAENVEVNGEKIPSVISGPPEQGPNTGNEPKPNATKMKAIADTVRSLSTNGAEIPDWQLEQAVQDALGSDVIVVKTKEAQAEPEDDVDAATAMKMSLDMFKEGLAFARDMNANSAQKQIAAPMSTLPAITPTTNVHFDKIHMDMPVELAQALKNIAEKETVVQVEAPVVNVLPTPVTVDMQPMADAMEAVASAVKNQQPPQVTVMPNPDSTETLKVVRDGDGLIDRIVRTVTRK